MDPSEVSLYDQIKAVKRELSLRQIVYPKRVAAQKMTLAESHRQIITMEAVLHTLEKVANDLDQLRLPITHNPPR